MKAINSQNIVILGGVLALTLATGCWGGGHGYSNNPYGYNDGSYTSNSYSVSSSGPNDGRFYPQNHGYANSYNTGYQTATNADTHHGNHQDHATAQHVPIAKDESQTPIHKETSSVAHNDYSRKSSALTNQSEKN